MKRFKVWWHCLWRVLCKEPHRMCSLQMIYDADKKDEKKGPKHHYCECGYLKSQFVKNFEPIMRYKE